MKATKAKILQAAKEEYLREQGYYLNSELINVMNNEIEKYLDKYYVNGSIGQRKSIENQATTKAAVAAALLMADRNKELNDSVVWMPFLSLLKTA